ncbi:hypothetical protein [Mucilaginibacter sp.]|jgi:hypothetical protein|uniref:hypothetical protein n=1 Tax=Mucilaginibacter sp. TaxID=1882438 RepID=UPI0026349AC7|nr:hypothetical protein [Mucilaginibacter sp.]MDB4926595.1 hypothetical protein [Mucilaginibacter sp.]
MREEFYQTYDLLYADYVYNNDIRDRRYYQRNFGLYEYDLVRIIRRAIDYQSNDRRVRPDAKYFLLVNFHNMIVRPLLEYRPFRNPERIYGDDPLELQVAIENDIKTIIDRTNEEADKDEEISGHAMMKAIDTLWPQLRTTKFEIWG